MTMVHVPRFRIKHQKFPEILAVSENFHSLVLNLGMLIILIHAVFGNLHTLSLQCMQII